MTTRWAVVGAGGMLGHDLLRVLDGRDALGLDRAALDVTDARACVEALRGIDVVVNAAAWTKVDDAETQEEAAFAVNALGPTHLAQACSVHGARLVQVSTDYVFAGDATTPYAEEAPTAPRSAYGRTKAAGEEGVRVTLPDTSWVVRTAWLYGEHGPSFVRTMARLEATRETVDVVDDQRGQPTWSHDLAQRIIALVDADAPAGTYHATASGETTWFGLARKVFELLGADPERVRPTTSEAFVRPAPRPAYSVLADVRGPAAGLAPMPAWEGALERALHTFSWSVS